MEITLHLPQKNIDISQLVTTLTISGEYRTCCRSGNIGILTRSIGDCGTTIQVGDIISVVHDGRCLFFGVVWDKSVTSDGLEVTISMHDFGIYLNKNSASYHFTQITPESIVARIATDYGLKLGSVAVTGKPISRIFWGNSLYDIILSSYNLAETGKKYLIVFDKDLLTIIEKGSVQAPDLLPKQNLMVANYTSSLGEMINRIKVYNDDDMLLSTDENKAHIEKYGLLGQVVRKDTSAKATTPQEKLQGVTEKIKVSNLGNAAYTTGKKVFVVEEVTGLKGVFYIDEDVHRWKNGIYTNTLTLNYENMADESEDGK